MGIYDIILKRRAEGKKLLAVLVDPDKASDEHIASLTDIFRSTPPDLILVGGSLVAADTEAVVRKLKSITDVPVVLFPGNGSQVAPSADAMLLLSLISGRNADYLVGQHVNSALQIRQTGLETIPTGYILIDGGSVTSVQYISGTMPIPRTKTDIAVATAVAGEMLGLKMLYLEAGSGASQPVPEEMVRAVRKHVNIPVIVGGGLRDIDSVKNMFKAGADVIVLGTIIEKDPYFLQKLFGFIAN